METKFKYSLLLMVSFIQQPEAYVSENRDIWSNDLGDNRL